MGNRKGESRPSGCSFKTPDVSSVFYFLFSIFLFSFFLTGCAAPGEPNERKPAIPSAIADLSARQLGSSVVLTFSLPKQSENGRRLKSPPWVTIYRDFQAAPSSGAASVAAAVHPTLLMTISPPALDTLPATLISHYTDTLTANDISQHTGEEAVYVVRTSETSKRRKDSADSNIAAVRIYPAPERITDLKAQVTQEAVVLTWTPPQKTVTGSAPVIAGYRVYRRELNVPANAASKATGAPIMNVYTSARSGPEYSLPFLAETTSSSYRDSDVEFNHLYLYTVRSVVEYGSDRVESDDSSAVSVTPEDVFPPAAPLGLEVVFVPAEGLTPASLDLSWAISPETDVAGYNVYRSEQQDTRGTRLNKDLLLTPAFRDMNAVSGRHYFYSVTAVDRSGNESLASAAVSASLPGQQKAP
ncbi:MAG: fibronectin type III domain-containing protein [Candidatus Acidiferrales bacterium]